MIRQRGYSFAKGAALGLLAALLASLLPSRAGAVQIFIDSAFVHRKNGNCFAESQNGVIRFRCPPLPLTMGCGGSPSPACTGGFGNADPSTTPACSTGVCPFGGAQPTTSATNGPFGNISNDAHIEFDQYGDAGPIFSGAGANQGSYGASNCDARSTNIPPATPPPPLLPPPLPLGDTQENICNQSVFLCASVGYGNQDSGTGSADVTVDEMSFEIFQYVDGTNPLDPGTPILRTFFIDQPGFLPGNCNSNTPAGTLVTNADGPNQMCPGPLGPFCVLWDGAVNLQGAFGKRNGQFGFRANVKTNQTGQSGNIQITAQRAYPSGSTRNVDTVGKTCSPADPNGCIVPQMPVTIDVTNVHVVRSSPTLVGSITPVPSEPYNLTYRLSKDATMFITITDSFVSSPSAAGFPFCGAGNAPCFQVKRTILNGIARVGEGIPNGSLLNGDSWNGRADNGDLLPPGVFLASFQAFSSDQFGADLSAMTTIELALDPLQITDIRVTPLLAGATSLAVLNYVLTEPATVYIDIYPPGTQFCNISGNVNQTADMPGGAANPLDLPKDFQPSAGPCPGPLAIGTQPVKRIVVQQTSRAPVLSFWDGRDQQGNVLGDGNYVFMIYAALPSQNGALFRLCGATYVAPFCSANDARIWTSQVKSGYLPILRGLPGISQVIPTSSVIGSSPPVAGLNPFVFRYSLAQDSIVNMKIFDQTGTQLIRTIVSSETRPGQFPLSERWDPATNDAGFLISSGVYMVQLTAADPLFRSKVSTTTALFPVDLFRITDIASQPLLAGASDFVSISYQLSQTMVVALNIYPPGTIVQNTTVAAWPPCPAAFPGGGGCPQILTPNGSPANPVVNIHGIRTGRLRITENWDGRDTNGLLVPDGEYVFVLVAQSTGATMLGNSPPFAVDRVVGSVSIQRGQIVFPSFSVNPDIPTLFNSSTTIALQPFTINYSVTRQSSVTIQILNTAVPPSLIRTIVAGGVRQSGILLSDVWDGRDDFGNFPPQGFYIVRALATDLATQLSSGSTAQVTIAFDPLRIYDLAVTPLQGGGRNSSILFQVSEPMKVAIKIFKPGTSFDLAGNPSPPEKISLVKRIVSVKAARTQLEDVWDGTDLRLALVPDGVYKFRIVGSTDVNAIDNITANILNPGALAEDRLIDEIPVTVSGSFDPLDDFERNSFVFPNPVTGPQATFEIYMPFQGNLKVRIHNIAGQLVVENDFGLQAASFAGGPFLWVWTKTNAAGRNVARGVYYVVIRAEESLGSRRVFQTVKKILLP